MNLLSVTRSTIANSGCSFLLFLTGLTLIACSDGGKRSYTESDVLLAMAQDDTSQFNNLSKQLDFDTLAFENNQTILYLAVKNNAFKICQKLVANKALIDSVVDAAPLHYTVYNNNIALTDLLLRNGANVNIQTSQENNTPLHLAVKNENVDLIKLLLQFNPIDTLSNFEKKNALEASIESSNPEVIALFGEKYTEEQKLELVKNSVRYPEFYYLGESIIKQDWISKNTLQEAFIFVSDTTLGRAILQQDIDVNYVSKKYKYNALHHSAIRGDTTMISFLIKNGANVNQKSAHPSPKTPLMYAKELYDDFQFEISSSGFVVTVNEAGRDFFAVSQEKNKENSAASVKLLLNHGAQ